MIKKSIKHLITTVVALWKYQGLIEVLTWFFPVKWIRGQALFMRPYFYNGYFSMKSINKLKGR